MAAKTPSLGMNHPTVVPTNFEQVSGDDNDR